MPFFPASLENLIDKFASLPGIGRKSAQRLAFHVLSLPEGEGESFANAILEARKNVCCCKICQNLTEGEVCSVCASTKRDKSIVWCSVTHKPRRAGRYTYKRAYPPRGCRRQRDPRDHHGHQSRHGGRGYGHVHFTSFKAI